MPRVRLDSARRAPRLLAVLAAAAALSCAHGWTGPKSDHFDGKRFHSLDPVDHSFGEWIKRMWQRRRGPWPDYAEAAPGPKPPDRVAGGALRVTYVNHATVLVQMDGVNILTDPTWAKRADPVIGARRRRPPGLRFEDLPPIDAVLVSHDHHDHMDLPTLRRLSDRFGPAIVAGLGTAPYLERHGVGRGRDLDWWQSTSIASGVTVTAVPARHHSRRGLFDANRRLWCGFVVTGPSGTVYFAGDTGFGSHVPMIAARFPRPRLALLPIGGFVPEWYMHPQHMSPADAVRAAQILGAGTTVPIHWGTFPASDDAERQPLDELAKALAAAAEERPSFVVLENGQSLDVPRESE